MIIESPHTHKMPQISKKAFIAPNATLIGDVIIEEGANIWYGAVIRADVCTIHIGKNTSIQDNCVLHSEVGTKLEIGENCIIGHHAMVHGPSKIGNNVTIGINAVVLQNTNIGDNSLIAANAVARKDIAKNSMIVGVPGKLKKVLEDSVGESTKKNALFYAENGAKFRESGINHPNIEEFLKE